MKYYQCCLASNACRFFSKEDKYAYNKLMGNCFKNNKNVLLTTIVLNLLLIIISLGVDVACFVIDIPYWWTVLIRLPIAIASIFSFQVYKDFGLRVVEILLFSPSVFIPSYFGFLVFYITARTFVTSANYEPPFED